MTHHRELEIAIAGAAVIVLLIVLVVYLIFKSRKKRQYPAKVHDKWVAIQRLCAKKTTWPQAVLDADKLLAEALKRKHFKGKSIGEKLVSAQRKLTNNDAVWYAHNLAKKLANDTKGLREAEVKKALIGFRQALRDLGVLNDK